MKLNLNYLFNKTFEDEHILRDKTLVLFLFPLQPNFEVE